MNRSSRPVVVMIAACLMWLMALLHLASAVTLSAALGETTRAFRDLARRQRFDPTDIDAGITGLRSGLICTAAVMVLFALLLAGLAYGIWRGNRPARIVTWVACGLGVLGACCTGIGSTLTFSTAEGADTLGNVAVSALPTWAAGVVVGSSALTLLGYIATAVLLAVPAANAFFKRGGDSGRHSIHTHTHHPHSHTHPSYPQPPAHPSHPAPPPSEP